MMINSNNTQTLRSLCDVIARTLGTKTDSGTLGMYLYNPTNGVEMYTYDDDIISITSAVVEGDNRVHVIKKDNGNPVLISDEQGKVYRYHGEMTKVKHHLLVLMAGICNTETEHDR